MKSNLNITSQSYTGGYRYGFQGQEQDNEVKGQGNAVNYKYRMHDPRVGRFFAVDPLTAKYPWYTPYQFSGNKVIHAVELEGLEEQIIFNYDDNTTKIYMGGTISMITSDELFSSVYNQLRNDFFLTGTLEFTHTSSYTKAEASSSGWDYIFGGGVKHVHYNQFNVKFESYDYLGDKQQFEETIDVAFGSTPVIGSSLLDFALSGIGTGFYSGILNSTYKYGKGFISGGLTLLKTSRQAAAGNLAALAEIKVAKYLANLGVNVKFLEPLKDAKQADFLLSGIVKADVKYMGLKNAAKHLKSGAQQVGSGGTVYWVIPNGSKATAQQAKDFLKKFKPLDSNGEVIKNVRYTVLKESDLPSAFGK